MKSKYKITILVFAFFLFVFLQINGDVFANENENSQLNIVPISFTSIESTVSDNVIITSKSVSSCKKCHGEFPLTTTAMLGSTINSSNFGGDFGLAYISSAIQIINFRLFYVVSIFCLIVLLTGRYLRFTTGVSPPSLLYIR